MRALILIFLGLIVSPVARADTALLIANSRYDHAQNLLYASQIATLERRLSQVGFDVIVVRNGTADAMRAGVSALLEAQETDRILIAVAGHMVRSRDGSWLLGRDADRPDLGTVGGQGLALSVLYEVASTTPGRSIVMLSQEPRSVQLGSGLARGIGPINAPQGVTILSGAPDDVAQFTRQVVLQPGADILENVRVSQTVRNHGFLTSAIPFLPAAAAPQPGPVGPTAEELALWQAVAELDTAGAYRAYLQQYPAGAFAAQARAAIARFDVEEIDPLELAEAAEAALGLTRSNRQQIQRDLTILDYRPRGIDGIFGPGTRSAIRRWQGDNDLDETSFLTRPQIALLRQQGSQRAAELEEEDRRRREAEERADRAYWQATGQGSTEQGLRLYIERYPEGQFAEIARARIDEIEEQRRGEAEAQERADWDAVRERDTIGAYRRYLERYPDGLFVDIARARMADLSEGSFLNPDERAQAQARENALNLPQITRLLIERRLANADFDPGPVDGQFDAQTRTAIRRYQRSRGMTVTGYLEQITVVRLLAEAIGGRIIE